jgi:outer membrane receptor protein involved in Fe transport
LSQTSSTSLLSSSSTAQDTANYRNDPILKYRFEHLVNADLELVFTVKKKHKLSVGFTYRYYSFMRSVDKIFYDVDPIFGWGAVEFRENNSKGDHVFDLRASAELTENIKLAVIMKNVANRIYALRPLKVNAPRSTQLQLTVQF